MNKPKWKRTKSRTITAYNLPLERAYSLIYDALAQQESGEDEEVREAVHIQVTHKRRVK